MCIQGLSCTRKCAGGPGFLQRGLSTAEAPQPRRRNRRGGRCTTSETGRRRVERAKRAQRPLAAAAAAVRRLPRGRSRRGMASFSPGGGWEPTGTVSRWDRTRRGYRHPGAAAGVRSRRGELLRGESAGAETTAGHRQSLQFQRSRDGSAGVEARWAGGVPGAGLRGRRVNKGITSDCLWESSAKHDSSSCGCSHGFRCCCPAA